MEINEIEHHAQAEHTAADGLACFAVVVPGLEKIAAAELNTLAVHAVQVVEGGVNFTGSMDALCRINLRARSITRVLVRLAGFKALSFPELFNKAVEVMIRARRLVKDDGARTELDVGVARIYERKSAAERQFGTPEKAAAYRDEAVAAYQSVIMFRDPNDAAVAPHLQAAYAACLPLMVEMERWDDVVQDAQKYLEAFPNGKDAPAVRQAQNIARVKGGSAKTGESNGETSAADDEPLL